MINSTFWIGFFIAVLLINISPGPEMIFVLSSTVSRGKKHGVLSCFGTATGSAVHVMLVACGLAIVLSTSLIAFTAIKIAGAAWLVYLGIKAIRSHSSDSIELLSKTNLKRSLAGTYKKGFLVGLLNPKSIIFFLSFLPQFIRSNKGLYSVQVLYLGFITIMVGVLFEIFLIIIFKKISDTLKTKKIIISIIDKLMGTILVFLGIKIAFSTQTD